MTKEIKQWDVWLVDFPLEENRKKFLTRPAIVLSVDPLQLLSLKITKHKPRDKYDVVIYKWKEAGLRYQSTARTSKPVFLSRYKFIHKLGVLDEFDRINVDNSFREYIEHKKSNTYKIKIKPR